MIKIAIVDDHALLREGLIKLLSNLGNFKVVAQFENGENFIQNFHKIKNNIDVFIIDYSMPGLSGLEILEQLHDNIEASNFLILSQSIDAQTKFKFYKLGAKGFLSKTCTGEELKKALTDIVNVGYYNVKENIQFLKNTFADLNYADMLTKKELEFIELSCNDNEYTYKQISDLMNVSIKTVDYYRKSIFEKLNIKSKVGLVLFSFKHKLTKPFL